MCTHFCDVCFNKRLGIEMVRKPNGEYTKKCLHCENDEKKTANRKLKRDDDSV